MQGKVVRKAFAQESFKSVTLPTSARNYTPKSSKSSSPQDVHFLAHFYFHRNQITLSICGDTSFLPSFLRSNVIFKAISHISGSKKWSKRRGTHRRTHTQTDRRTSKFWGLLHRRFLKLVPLQRTETGKKRYFQSWFLCWDPLFFRVNFLRGTRKNGF